MNSTLALSCDPTAPSLLAARWLQTPKEADLRLLNPHPGLTEHGPSHESALSHSAAALPGTGRLPSQLPPPELSNALSVCSPYCPWSLSLALSSAPVSLHRSLSQQLCPWPVSTRVPARSRDMHCPRSRMTVSHLESAAIGCDRQGIGRRYGSRREQNVGHVAEVECRPLRVRDS